MSTATRPVTYRVEIPGWAPPSVNRLLRLHWAAAARVKKRAYHTVAVACLAAGVPRAVGKRRVWISIIVGGRSGVCDPDNVCKVMLDALVNCGALVDDRSAWVELGCVQVNRGAGRYTIIDLEEIP